MSNTIRLKRASGSDPGASDLVTGEVAVRTDNGKLFTKKDDNSVAEIGGGISDVVDDTSPQLGGDLASNGNDIDFADNDKAIFGTGGDLEIYHASGDNNSYIHEAGSGHLVIKADDLYIQNAGGTENLAVLKEDGAVELYHDNSKAFETIAAGGKIYNLSGEARLEIQGYEGNGAYLQLNADDGDDNADYWRAYAGTDGTFHIQNYASGSWETNIKATGNGAAELYYDNSKKFETTNTGAEVTGNFGVSGVTYSDGLDMDDDHKILLGTGDDLEIYHNGSDSFIAETGTGQLKISGSAGVHIMKYDHVEVMASFYHDAACEFYYNNVKKIETTASGVAITGNATSSVSSLTDGATITVDFSSATHFTVTLGGNRTFGDPGSTSNAIGSSGSIFIIQDGTGSRTASFHGDYKFAGGTAPTLSTAANAVDRLDYVVRASDNIHCVVTLDVK